MSVTTPALDTPHAEADEDTEAGHQPADSLRWSQLATLSTRTRTARRLPMLASGSRVPRPNSIIKLYHIKVR